MTDPAPNAPIRPTVPLWQNWISLIGIILALSSFFAVACLIALDFYRAFTNPYMGILTYMVAPVFLSGGIAIILGGILWERRRRRRLLPGEIPAHPRIDFNLPHHRRTFVIVMTLTIIFLVFTALGSYRTYHFTNRLPFAAGSVTR